MRNLVLATLITLTPVAVAARTTEAPAEAVAMTTLLRVCLEHAQGTEIESLARRAESGGFQRRPDQGGALGEDLTWRNGGKSEVRLLLRRDECRIEVSHGEVDAARLADGVAAWAMATNPAFSEAQAPPADPLALGDEPVSRKLFRRGGVSLMVDRFAPPTGGFNSLFANQAVVISLTRR